jgi:Fe-S cluster assembly protein SufD
VTVTSPLLDRLLPADPPGTTDGPAALDARAWLETVGLPTTRDEAWRYTALGRVLTATFAPAAPPPSDWGDLATVNHLAGDHGGPRLVFVNGYFAPHLSRAPGIDTGVRARNGTARPTLPPGPGRRAPGTERYRFDGFQALNEVAARDGSVIEVDAERVIPDPVHVVHLSVPGAEPPASHPRTVLQVGANSEVTFVETYAGLPGAGLTNATTTIVVGPGATVTHAKVQAEGAGATHLAHTGIHQGAGSTVRSRSFMFGAEVARNAVDAVLAGDGAHIELDGLYLPAATQRHDHVVTVEHAASACTSRQLFKGVIDDRARGSFSGRIIVQPGTTATDAAQTSRSLVLTPTAEADTRPWLEIFADDVRCTHGATVGRLDAEALFYLRTRGIAPDEARTMLIRGFVAEMTEALQPSTLRSRLDEMVASRRSVGPTPEEDDR